MQAHSLSLLLRLLYPLSLKTRLVIDGGGDRVEEPGNSLETNFCDLFWTIYETGQETSKGGARDAPKSCKNQCRSREEKGKRKALFLKKLDRLSEQNQENKAKVKMLFHPWSCCCNIPPLSLSRLLSFTEERYLPPSPGQNLLAVLSD